MSDPGRSRPGPVRTTLALLRCFARSLPRFFAASPKTPLRVLGIISLDTLRTLRTSQPLPRRRIDELAMVLDFLGTANAAWDRKDRWGPAYEATRQRLRTAGLGDHIDTYVTRLRDLESRRPQIGGDRRRFEEVRAYREAVASLCVGTAAAIALDANGAERSRLAAHDVDVDTLIRILLQCQVIDDVADYREDLAAGLPSFLTATTSLSQAMLMTAAAARSYGALKNGSGDDAILPFRVTLALFTLSATVVLHVAQRWHRHDASVEEMCRRVGT
jgi:hypothetical protein